MALLRGLLELAEPRYLSIYVAHLNHSLRGAESDRDAAWLTDTCRSLGVTLIAEKVDVAAIARERGDGIEEAARHARYEFLENAAAETLSTHVALGHTADDQAETILHHIVRGTGLAGLRGMPATRNLRSGRILARPLLAVRRGEILEYLSSIEQDFREDASNAELAHTRNQIRGDLLPLLERDYNPQVRAALLRLGQQAAEQQKLLESLAVELLERAVCDKTESVCRLKWDAMRGQPRHLIRASFQRLWQDQGWPRQQMGFAEWERLAELAAKGGAATLPGKIHARGRGGLLVLERR